MRGLDAGELSLFVRLAIWERWLRDKKASYAYELAWVFQRDRGTIGNVLAELEAKKAVELVSPKIRSRRMFYKPTQGEVIRWALEKIESQEDELSGWFKELHEKNCPCVGLGKHDKV